VLGRFGVCEQKLGRVGFLFLKKKNLTNEKSGEDSRITGGFFYKKPCSIIAKRSIIDSGWFKSSILIVAMPTSLFGVTSPLLSILRNV
jgi:hypothetical protein